MYTTAADLVLWVRNFRTGDPGARIFKEMTTRYELTNGEMTKYGLGLYVDRWRGQLRAFHGGDDVAHRSIVVYFPELDAGVILMSNNASFDQYGAADQLAGVLFRNELSRQAGNRAHPSLKPAELDQYVGRYELVSTPGFVFTFRRDGKQLLSEATDDVVALIPLSNAEFRVVGQDARIRFHRDSRGGVTSATILDREQQTLRRLAADEVVARRPVDLTGYAGLYHSKELETHYSLEVDGDVLLLGHRLFQTPVRLRPMQGERFSGLEPTESVRFERDARGLVRGFHVGNGSNREYVWFEREE